MRARLAALGGEKVRRRIAVAVRAAAADREAIAAGYDAIIDHTAPGIKLRRPVCVACNNGWMSEQEKRVEL